MKKIKIVRPKYPFQKIWTEEEVQILKDNYLDYNQRELSEKFLTRFTPLQVNSKKMEMRLIKPPVWSNEERELMLKHGANHFHYDLQAKFFPNKTLQQISGMRKHLGVRRKKVKEETADKKDEGKKASKLKVRRLVNYDFK